MLYIPQLNLDMHPNITLRKPTTDATSQNTPAAKKSHHRVVKRPARGYHKFKNGILNVAPKGSEKEL
jgi:hypothetical protein